MQANGSVALDLSPEGLVLPKEIASPPRIIPSSHTQPAPLSLAQLSTYSLAQRVHSPIAGHVMARLQIRGNLDRRRLHASLDLIVARHEALRATLYRSGVEPALVFAQADCGFSLLEEDVGLLEAAEQVLLDESNRPFDLSTGPLIRGRLLWLSDQEHVLLITVHPIISDRRSVGILLGELGAIYTALSQGEKNPLQPLPLQYADFSRWQRGRLQGTALHKQLDFWKEHLAGAPEMVQLPTDRPRAALRDSVCSCTSFTLSPELTYNLWEFVDREGATLVELALSAWIILLGRLSGQEEVVIGMSVANRPTPELERLIGSFENILPLRARFQSETVAGLLQHVRTIASEARAHQDVPFGDVVEALQPTQGGNQHPVFQVRFSVTDAPEVDGGVDEMSDLVVVREMPNSPTGLDLDLCLQVSNSLITGQFGYAPDLFDPGTIERWIGHFKSILEEMVLGADRNVAELQMLIPAERDKVLFRFNGAPLESPSAKVIQELFETLVEQTPDAVAVVYEDECLTYQQLNSQANRLARYLRSQGVGPDQLVGICVERSLEMLVGILAILKAGGAYVPLDPSYPRDSLTHIFQDADLRLCLTQERVASRLAGSGVALMSLDGYRNEFAKWDDDNLSPAEVHITGQHLAYVIYTSGSTGSPKGTMIEHRSLLNLWNALETSIYLGRTDCRRVGVNASFAFDASVKQLVQLLSGRTLVIIPQAIRADAGELFGFMTQQQLDCLDCTPGQLDPLIAAGMLQLNRHALQVVLVGGEAIDSALWARLGGYPDVSFYNVYGPTECTVDATVALIRPPLRQPTIGRPIANTQVYILDRNLQPVPIGVVGEIYIAGAGVARGYLRRPELTAERFLPNPFGHLHRRMYKTGDLGRWLADGTIEYLGRNDHQVKIRGFRIELGEIEAQLLRNTAVREALVVAREDVPGEKRLVAYVTLRGESEGGVASMREYLKTVLPDYMIPSAFVTLDSFPRTPNGKVDRRALPVPALEAYASERYEVPQGGTEEALADIWRDLFQVARVGREDDFIGLGGHSLTAMKLIVRVAERFNTQIHFMTVFEYPTIRTLASVIEKLQSAEGSAA